MCLSTLTACHALRHGWKPWISSKVKMTAQHGWLRGLTGTPSSPWTLPICTSGGYLILPPSVFHPSSQQELQCDAASGVMVMIMMMMMMAVARDDVRLMHLEKEKKLSVWAVRCGQSWQKPPKFCKLNKNQRISNDESGKGWQQLMLWWPLRCS